MPSEPSGLGSRVPVGTGGSNEVGASVGRVVGTAAGSSLTQYVEPGTSEQVEIVGLSWMNCVTVREFEPDRDAQVSPAIAVTVRVQVAATAGLRYKQAARRSSGTRD